MRVPPVRNPRSLVARITYWMARRQLGKVPEAFQVIYGNAPALARTSYSILQTTEKRLSLPEELRLLVATQSSLMNGCSFCADLHQAQAIPVSKPSWLDSEDVGDILLPEIFEHELLLGLLALLACRFPGHPGACHGLPGSSHVEALFESFH